VPDYRIYTSDGKGGMKEIPVEELAHFLGFSEFDANLTMKGINIVKAICVTAGRLESPPLVWNVNMPGSLLKFVTEHVYEQLTGNPAWEIEDFDWSLIYEGNELKYK